MLAKLLDDVFHSLSRFLTLQLRVLSFFPPSKYDMEYLELKLAFH